MFNVQSVFSIEHVYPHVENRGNLRAVPCVQWFKSFNHEQHGKTRKKAVPSDEGWSNNRPTTINRRGSIQFSKSITDRIALERAIHTSL